MIKRIHFVITVPESFVDKFVALLKNINIINFRVDQEEPVVVIENVFKKDDVAAMPKGMVDNDH